MSHLSDVGSSPQSEISGRGVHVIIHSIVVDSPRVGTMVGEKRIEESAVGGDSKSVGWSLTCIGRATTRGDKHCHSSHSGNKEN